MRTFFTFLLCISIFQIGIGQWEFTGGPEGGSLNNFKVSGDFIYGTGHHSGLFRSSDGMEWEEMDLGLNHTFQIKAWHISGDSVMILGADPNATTLPAFQLFFSENLGMAWREIDLPIGDQWGDELFFKNDQIIFMEDNRIVYSEDFGANWFRNNQFSVSHNYDLEVHPSGYFVMGSDGIYHTSDDLGNWNRLPNSREIDFFHVYKNSIISYDLQQDKFLKSDDFGLNWRTVLATVQLSNNIDFFENENRIVFASSDKIYFSDDGGENWTTKDDSIYNRWFTDVAYFKNKFLATFVFNSPPYSSSDGKNWTVGGKGITTSAQTKNLKNYKGDLLCSSFLEGIRRYDLSTETWSSERFLNTKNTASLFEVFQNRIFTEAYIDTVRIYEEGVPGWIYPKFHTDQNIHFDLTEGFLNHNEEVIFIKDHLPMIMFSTDGGNNFYPFNLSVSGNYSGFIYDFASDEDLLYVVGNSGFGKSNNLWQDSQKIVLPGSSNDFEIRKVMTNNGVVAVTEGEFSIKDKAFFSFDKGENWTESNFPESRIELSGFVFLNEIIFANFSDFRSMKIYFSLDRGKTWEKFQKGLPRRASVSDFMNIGNTLFLSTRHQGIWKYDLTDFTPVENFADSKEAFNIFPNPTPNSFFIKKEKNTLISGEVKIYSLNGNIQKTFFIKNEMQPEVDVSDFSKGIYFLQLIENEQVVVKKLVVD